ncbi:hypothetical protein C8F04DRAFT_1205054 [Mycena alexandri]|uniref:Uncharacterized protein n=1 Tax=Mycena alexandri TaxID=1745969 RepID=A0AAD6RV79_9AGAR|nr:hypothetical protein C8F04DRAFT_1205054 [Mycena alexandri]
MSKMNEIHISGTVENEFRVRCKRQRKITKKGVGCGRGYRECVGKAGERVVATGDHITDPSRLLAPERGAKRRGRAVGTAGARSGDGGGAQWGRRGRAAGTAGRTRERKANARYKQREGMPKTFCEVKLRSYGMQNAGRTRASRARDGTQSLTWVAGAVVRDAGRAKAPGGAAGAGVDQKSTQRALGSQGKPFKTAGNSPSAWREEGCIQQVRKYRHQQRRGQQGGTGIQTGD